MFFATPSPRLIPEGETPDTFTGLALASYEGRTGRGGMVGPTDAQRARLAAAGVATHKVQALSEAFNRESLPPAAFDVLVNAVEHLAYFERDDKPKIKTEGERLASVAAVEAAAAQLRDAIERLEMRDFIGLNGHLWNIPDFPYAQDVELYGRMVSAQRLACQIAAAARAYSAESERDGNGGKGRKQTRSAYAGHIAALAHQLMPFNVVPGDGGPFRRLCDAVFSAAGVGATAQGAIKYFNAELRPGYKARGGCL